MIDKPRRWALALLGVIALGVAGSIDPGFVGDPDRAVLYEALAPNVRAGLWTACGLVSIAGAIRHRWQWIGYAAAVLMPVERAASHLWAWLAWIIPGVPSQGSPDGLAHAVTWAAYAALIGVLAGARGGAGD